MILVNFTCTKIYEKIVFVCVCERERSTEITHTRAFCLGVVRQHITESQLTARCKNAPSRFWLRMNDSDFPSIIKAKEIERPPDELSSNFPPLI